ncbi:leucine-rich repeat protein 1 isoform X2 [Sitodiplosis mosellana]|uniref:leucine-rich repeat protein 1 isoform X2 n=1 Tax=Sitodiplosis mosellana TaxID=263140 RepID=UPI0024445316|nr:leucine-rich repeat protein 1 isoform X2 [Sitodiplosis mosellana]
MKIFCEISVYNRLAPHVKPRSQQSTLALGYHPPGGGKDAENLFLIHFTAINTVGTRYKLHRNIEKVFTKFVLDGKTTISLKQPPHDLQIRCEPIQLMAFMKMFKGGLEGKLDPTKPSLSTLAVTAVPKKAVPVKSMTILTPSDYPLKGLPKTLTTLNVNGIRKCSLDAQILSLNNLQILNMSNNNIEHLPKRLGDLPIVQLDLSNNRLGKSVLSDWDWLDKQRIKSSLQNFNLSNNDLMVLTLKANRLTRVPFAIRRLKTLRTLNLADNQIKSLPNVFSRMSFDTLDVSGDEMLTSPYHQHEPDSMPLAKSGDILRQPAALWQIAAMVVTRKVIKYGPYDLPMTVIDSLEEYPMCECGRLCPPNKIHFRTCVIQTRTNSLIQSLRLPILGDSVYCSDYCQLQHSGRNKAT